MSNDNEHVMDDSNRIEERKLIGRQKNNGQDAQQERIKQVKMAYLAPLVCTVSLGSIIFGFSIASWNCATNAYFQINPADTADDQTSKQSQVQTVTVLGSAITAFFGGPMLQIGRRNCILLTNILVIVGSIMQLQIYSHNYNLFLIGRFLFGCSAGAFSLFCPKFLSEISPTEYKGAIGSMSQLGVTFGILIPAAISLQYQDPKSISPSQNKFFVTMLVALVPIILSVIQIFLLITIFKYDTPVFLQLKGDQVSLNEIMSNIYHPYVVQERIAQLSNGDEDVLGEMKGSDKAEVVGYTQVLFGAKYRRSTFVGCMLAMFQQFTGINAIMFYSNLIFESSDGSDAMSAVTLTFMLNTVNFLATFGGMYLLSKAGRKTILIATCILLGVFNILIGWTYSQDYHTFVVVASLSMIAFFEFGSGPITWLYMAEIMQDKGSSLATVLNWLVSLAISLFLPQIVQKYGKKESVSAIFYVFGATTIVGVFFMMYFMKETRGKSQKEIEEMFYSVKQNKQPQKQVANTISDSKDNSFQTDTLGAGSTYNSSEANMNF